MRDPDEQAEFENLFQEAKDLLLSPSCPPEVVKKVEELLGHDLNFIVEAWNGQVLIAWLENNYAHFLKDFSRTRNNFFLKLPRYKPYLLILEDILTLFELTSEE